MNATSEDIIKILEAYGESSGLGLDFAQNLFQGLEPSEPKNCVTVFDSPGFPDELILDGNTGYESPGINIRVRNTKYNTGMDIARNIKNVLHGYSGTVGDTLYTVITCVNGPALLDWDENRNARFIINFNVQRRPA